MLRVLALALTMLLPTAFAHPVETREDTLLLACAGGSVPGLAAFVSCGRSRAYDVAGGMGNHTAAFSWPDAADRLLEVCLEVYESPRQASARKACVVTTAEGVLTLPASENDVELVASVNYRVTGTGPQVVADALTVHLVLTHTH